MGRTVELQIRVFLHHGQIISGVIRRDPGFLVFHCVKNLVHHVLLHHGLLLHQLGRALPQLGLIGSVYIITKQILRNSEGIPGVIEHQDLIGILFVPQQFPTGHILFGHVFAVVDDTDGTPGIGNGILVLRIIRHVPEALVNILVIGDVIEVQLHEHPFLPHSADHIIGGDDHIHGNTAIGKLGVHDLVGVEGGVLHMDIGILFLKRGDHIQRIVVALGNILSPVINVQRCFLTAAGSKHGGTACKQADGQAKRHNSFHFYPSFLAGAVTFRKCAPRLSSGQIPIEADSLQSSEQKSAGTAG